MAESKLNLAGRGQRIMNVIIDMITFLILWLILSFILIAFGLSQTYTDETGEEMPIIPLIILIPTFWTYYILTEYRFQKTLGKLLTKTIVVSVTGGRPTMKQIVFRTLSRSIPFEYLSYLITIEGIHDKLSKTRVTNVENIIS